MAKDTETDFKMYTNKSEDKNKTPDDQPDQKFLKLRTIVISEDINHKVAAVVVKHALMLEDEDPKKPVRVFINSPGGEVSSGFSIYDMLKFIQCPIHTIINGLAASMGSVVSLAGDSGKIFSLPNARIMIHQPLLTGAKGNITDLKIHAEEIKKTKDHIIRLYCEKTKKNQKQIARDVERDHWFNAAEAMKYGLIDGIISTREELNKLTG